MHNVELEDAVGIDCTGCVNCSFSFVDIVYLNMYYISLQKIFLIFNMTKLCVQVFRKNYMEFFKATDA